MTIDYRYKAEVVGVYDGDTIRCNIDLGFGVWLYDQRIRLRGIDAPEVRGPEREEGLRTRDWLRAKVELQTYKDKQGKYGRWIADVFIGGQCINELLVHLALAEATDYGA